MGNSRCCARLFTKIELYFGNVVGDNFDDKTRRVRRARKALKLYRTEAGKKVWWARMGLDIGCVTAEEEHYGGLFGYEDKDEMRGEEYRWYVECMNQIQQVFDTFKQYLMGKPTGGSPNAVARVKKMLEISEKVLVKNRYVMYF